MRLAPDVVKMIKEYIAINGDPFAPFESVTDYGSQQTAYMCNGCNAVGMAKWPKWKLEMAHEPNCAWVTWNQSLNAPDDL